MWSAYGNRERGSESAGGKAVMRMATIKKLIRLVEESKISELEVGRFGTRVRISKNSGSPGGRPVLASDTSTAHQGAESPVKKRKEGLMAVVAPMVGTFYRAPAPDAPPYVEVGDYIKKGQILCIIEAMKLMNEIESEYEGRIADIPVKNEQPVGYGEELFLIEPAG